MLDNISVDAMMYMVDLMTCFDISAEEFTEAYEQKHAYNMERWQFNERK